MNKLKENPFFEKYSFIQPYWIYEVNTEADSSSEDESLPDPELIELSSDSDGEHQVITQSLTEVVAAPEHRDSIISENVTITEGQHEEFDKTNQIQFENQNSPSSYSNVSSYNDSEPEDSLKNTHKWCVCQNSDKAFGDTKMCDKCGQWYHLKCLNCNENEITLLIKNQDRFVCNVCKNDREFIEKFKHQISLRAKTFAVHNFVSDASMDEESSNSSNEAKIKAAKPALVKKKKLEEPACPQSKPLASELTEEEKKQKILHLKQKTPKPKTTQLIGLQPSKPKAKPSPLISTGIINSIRQRVTAPVNPPGTTHTVTNNVADKSGPFTANSTCQPVRSRKNLQCIQCKKSLRENNHPTPKELWLKFSRENKDLVDNWFEAIYCDEDCIYAHVEDNIKRKNDTQTVDLLDATTKSRKQQISSDGSKSIDAFRSKVYNFLCNHPKHFIIDHNYIRKFASSLSKIETIKPGHTPNADKSDQLLGKSKQPTTSTSTSKQINVPHTHKPAVKKVYYTTNDSNRLKAIDLLTKRFRTRINNATEQVRVENKLNAVNLNKMAAEIEQEIYNTFPNDVKKYNSKSIAIALSISNEKNSTFYLKILTGKLTPAQLPKMETIEMADDKVSEQRAKDQQFDIEQRIKYSDECNIEKSKPRIKYTHKGELYTNQDNCYPSSFNDKDSTSTGTESEAAVPSSTDMADSANSLVQTPELTGPNKDSTSISVPRSLVSCSVDTTSKHAEHSSQLVVDLNCKICLGQALPKSPVPIDFNLLERQVNAPIPPANILDAKAHDSDFEDFDVDDEAIPVQAISAPPIPVEVARVPPIRIESSPTNVFSSPSEDLTTNNLPNLENARFWEGIVITHEKTNSSMHAIMLSQGPLANKVKEISFPDSLQYHKDISMNFTYTDTDKQAKVNCNFWQYIEKLKQYTEAEIVFFSLHSNGSNKSSILVPNKEPIPFNDDDAYARFSILFNASNVACYRVPLKLNEHVGLFYMIGLQKKTGSGPDTCLLQKYGISVVRSKDQIIGIFIDIKTKQKHNLVQEFGLFFRDGEYQRVKALREAAPVSHKRKLSNSSEDNEIKSASKATEAGPSLAHKQKCIDTNLAKAPVTTDAVSKEPKQPKENVVRDPRLQRQKLTLEDKMANFVNTITTVTDYTQVMNALNTFTIDNSLNEEQANNMKTEVYNKYNKYFNKLKKTTQTSVQAEVDIAPPENNVAPRIQSELTASINPVEESSYYVVNEALKRLNDPSNTTAQVTLKTLLDLIKKKHGTHLQLTVEQLEKLKSDFGKSFTEFINQVVCMHEPKSNNYEYVSDLPPPERWQGESRTAFEELTRLHTVQRDTNQFKSWNYENTNWTLTEKSFRPMFNPYPEED